jgi:hypothetical protein
MGPCVGLKVQVTVSQIVGLRKTHEKKKETGTPYTCLSSKSKRPTMALIRNEAQRSTNMRQMNLKLNQVLSGLPAYKALANLENKAPLIQKPFLHMEK